MVLTSSGYNYFWLTYDIPSYAKLTDHVDAGCDSITIGNSTYAPDTNNPSGDRKIYYCIPPTSSAPCYMYISNVVLDSINNTQVAAAHRMLTIQILLPPPPIKVNM